MNVGGPLPKVAFLDQHQLRAVGREPATPSPARAGRGTSRTLPPLTFTRPIEDGEWPPAPSKAAVSPFGERINHETFRTSVVRPAPARRLAHHGEVGFDEDAMSRAPEHRVAAAPVRALRRVHGVDRADARRRCDPPSGSSEAGRTRTPRASRPATRWGSCRSRYRRRATSDSATTAARTAITTIRVARLARQHHATTIERRRREHQSRTVNSIP